MNFQSCFSNLFLFVCLGGMSISLFLYLTCHYHSSYFSHMNVLLVSYNFPSHSVLLYWLNFGLSQGFFLLHGKKSLV